MKLYIKNMVCIRCKMVVQDELRKINLPYIAVELGEVELTRDISLKHREQFRTALAKSGLALMDDKKSIIIEKIKTVIIELIHYADEPLLINFSDYLHEKLGYDYTYLANLFSEVLGTTIEKFMIAHKIERVKELLVYDELNLTEIAHLMHYSSVSHLSLQFKKVSGLSPTHFKRLKNKKLQMLEDI